MLHHDHQKNDYILNLLYIDEAFENIVAVATMYSSFKTLYNYWFLIFYSDCKRLCKNFVFSRVYFMI